VGWSSIVAYKERRKKAEAFSVKFDWDTTYTQSCFTKVHIHNARICQLGDTGLLVEVESDITHICLHPLKCKLDVVVLVLPFGDSVR